ncbi:Uncharacterised protein [Legionella lansingensis]|uniref:Uncharacterized protein n=1 Tax=Legionella lansingensis TaxID=45067 RepID=A0A0W0VF97_9GAMM|nr:hypothetical protein [Legionella lansingensis]KTD18820.1 hypothetical protein Llan_2423 [Legionella lansingensis]SNV43353.1 Uncharacterised protein [Legionella lansingensis]
MKATKEQTKNESNFDKSDLSGEKKIKRNPEIEKLMFLFNSLTNEMKKNPTKERLEELKSIDEKIHSCITTQPF